MALLFDLIAAQSATSKFHGGGEYAKAVLASVLSRQDRGEVLAAFRPDYYLDEAVEAAVRGAGIETIAVEGLVGLQRLISSDRITSFYSALPYGYGSLDFRSVRLAYTVHGLRPLECPTDHDEALYAGTRRDRLVAALKQRMPRTYRRRQREQFEALLRAEAMSVDVFVPSEHSRFAVLAEFSWLRPKQVHLAYSPSKPVPGKPLTPGERDRLLHRIGVTDDGYIMITSGDRWIKNGLRAARAMDHLYVTRPEDLPRTLVLGVRNPDLYARHLQRPDRFVFADYVEARELEALYGSAFLYLYPTLNEGFGYPPLEAMRHGTPVISAAVASTTELCGDAVLYVDPRSETEIQARVLRLALDEHARRDLGARGAAREAVVRRSQDVMLDSLTTTLLRLEETPVVCPT